MRTHAVLLSTVILSVATVTTGCSSGEQHYDQPEQVRTISKIQTFRESMQAYAQSGRTDSGTEALIEEADHLKEEGVTDQTVQQIKASLQEMISSGSGATVKKKAEEVLTMLPAAGSSPSGE